MEIRTLEQKTLLKTAKRDMVEKLNGEVSHKCKDMVLYVIHEVKMTEDDMSENKLGSDEEEGRRKGD